MLKIVTYKALLVVYAEKWNRVSSIFRPTQVLTCLRAFNKAFMLVVRSNSWELGRLIYQQLVVVVDKVFLPFAKPTDQRFILSMLVGGQLISFVLSLFVNVFLGVYLVWSWQPIVMCSNVSSILQWSQLRFMSGCWKTDGQRSLSNRIQLITLRVKNPRKEVFLKRSQWEEPKKRSRR